jgi:IclR family transcriptional regulator, acetate operon repressor
MSNVISRSVALLEELASHPEGRSLSELSSRLDIPLSATHRLLAELVECGYVRRDERHGDFMLAMKAVALGLRYLSSSGVSDVAQPILDRLARQSNELVRLALVEEDSLVFVAKAQGATHGLRYDPEMGQRVWLASSAAGLAWLSTMSDEEALRIVAKQGFGDATSFGPGAPRTIKALLTHIRATRRRGHAVTSDIFAPGMSSMATAVRSADHQVIGFLIVAGPSFRLSEERIEALTPLLKSTAEELSHASLISPMFKGKPSELAEAAA